MHTNTEDDLEKKKKKDKFKRNNYEKIYKKIKSRLFSIFKGIQNLNWDNFRLEVFF